MNRTISEYTNDELRAMPDGHMLFRLEREAANHSWDAPPLSILREPVAFYTSLEQATVVRRARRDVADQPPPDRFSFQAVPAWARHRRRIRPAAGVPAPQIIAHLKEQQTRLMAPQKKPKGKQLTDDEKYYNRLVRRIRQPIESLFNWIEEKTQIQRASKVRSTDALMIHCWGKLAVAFFLFVFNY